MSNGITQLILGTVVMPEVSNDKYVCWEEEQTVDLVMADRSMVRQVPDNHKVWRANYAYDLLDDDIYNAALELLQGGESFRATVLTSKSQQLVTSEFYCVGFTPATFAFSDGLVPVWHNLAFQLREVTPHA